MTVFQKKQAVVKSLRNVRRAHRNLQSKAESLERILDRLIDRKTLITPGQMAQLQGPFQAVRNQLASVEGALRDALIASTI